MKVSVRTPHDEHNLRISLIEQKDTVGILVIDDMGIELPIARIAGDGITLLPLDSAPYYWPTIRAGNKTYFNWRMQ